MTKPARKSCAYCRGDGNIGFMPCPACEGKGFVIVSLPATMCACYYGTGVSGCCRCTTWYGSGYANVIIENNN
ncbi:MAG: hypothetical protein MUF37_09105 [Methanoregulaceae archaeon]|jgi:hypothetical protein|nr:hypothetical protein [Methanoregulaceae archaeon]